MKEEIKLTLYAGGIVFFISMIIGVFAGNPAGVVFGRAFVSFILFGGLFYIGMYIIIKYVPQIISYKESKEKIQKTEAYPEAEEEEGKLVNYLVEDEESGKIPEGEKMDSLWEQSNKKKDEVYVEEKKSSFQVNDKTTSIENAETIFNSHELPSVDSLFERKEEEYSPQAEQNVNIKKSNKLLSKDYIQVGSARIPNEPEAIARAIKKVMKQNE